MALATKEYANPNIKFNMPYPISFYFINLFHENFPGHRFRTYIPIQTQIWLYMILTLATKHLMIINKDNHYLHLNVF